MPTRQDGGENSEKAVSIIGTLNLMHLQIYKLLAWLTKFAVFPTMASTFVKILELNEDELLFIFLSSLHFWISTVPLFSDF